MLPLYDPDAKHQKKAIRFKKYGIEQYSQWFQQWCFPTWYATEKARDQAFDRLTRTVKQVRKVNR